MANERQFGVGLLVLALANLGFVAWQLGHHAELVAIGVVNGIVLGVLGGLTASGRYGFVDGGQNRLLGVATVFGAVAGFGLVVVALMLAIE